MKRIISYVLVFVFALSFVLSGCSAKEKTVKDLKATGEIVMGTNAQFQPYEYYADDGSKTIIGIDVEIMQAVAEKLGVKLRIEDMEFDAIITAVSSGKVDVGAAGMTVDEDRLKNVNFTDTYTKAKQVIIVKNESPIADIEDLKGKTVGTQAGTTGELFASDAVEDGDIGAVERYSNGISAVQSLLSDKIDAVMIDNEPAKVFVSQNEGIKILEKEYTDEDYALAIAKQNKGLLEEINKALGELKSEGKLQAIIEKYIPAEQSDN